jgi:DeoR/GlpR family transcriptional regulator of sugar metabolism
MHVCLRGGGMFNRDDYMSVEEIASDWGFSRDTARRWIRKYADKSFVRLHQGMYYVHKDEVNRWRAAYEGKYPVKGLRVQFARLS